MAKLRRQTVEEKKRCWFIFHNQQLLFDAENRLPAQPIMQDDYIRTLSLGNFNQYSCFCAEVATTSAPTGHRFIPLRPAFDQIGHQWYPMLAKAISVLTWDRNHQYCGHCGAKTVHQSQAYERTCSQCGLCVYPRISPSVIVLIQRGDHVLMARSPHFAPGAYGLIAGFVEAGENLEQAVHREVYEETALTIKNLAYFDSQSWPFPDSLMVGFTADYAGGELIIDKTEIESAGWYRYNELPGRPSSKVGIASRLLDYFIAKQKAKV